jgi:PPIC-type PPIASE domain
MRSPRPFVLRRAGVRLRAATERLLVAIALTAAAALLLSSDPAAGSSQESGRALTLRMIAVTSAEAAQRIVERLNGGESFALLARAESIAPSADLGGWLGRVPVPQLRPEVRTALEGIAPGHITPVIRIPTGFAIFKVEEDEPSAENAKVGAALASSGAVKYVYDVGGFTDARLSLETLPKRRASTPLPTARGSRRETTTTIAFRICSSRTTGARTSCITTIETGRSPSSPRPHGCSARRRDSPPGSSITTTTAGPICT